MGKYLDVNSVLPESKSIRWISVAAISPDHLVAHLSPQMPPLLVPCSPGPSTQAPATSHPSSQTLDIAGEDGELQEKLKIKVLQNKIGVSKQFLARPVLRGKHKQPVTLQVKTLSAKWVFLQEKMGDWKKKLKIKVLQRRFVYRNNILLAWSFKASTRKVCF